MKQSAPLRTVASVTLAAVGFLAALSPQDGAAKEEDGPARARKAWQDTCRRCHTVPDARYETGRAFLAQITGTS